MISIADRRVRASFVSIGVGLFGAAVALTAGCSSSSSNAAAADGAVSASDTGGDGTLTTPPTTVSTSTNVSALSPADLTKLCNDVLAWQGSSFTAAEGKNLGCAITAAFAGGTVGDGDAGADASAADHCKSAYATCLAAGPSDAGSADAGTTDPCTGFRTSATDCNAPVADALACQRDRIQLFKTAADTSTAANVCAQFESETATDAGSSDPASCVKIATSCPGFANING